MYEHNKHDIMLFELSKKINKSISETNCILSNIKTIECLENITSMHTIKLLYYDFNLDFYDFKYLNIESFEKYNEYKYLI